MIQRLPQSLVLIVILATTCGFAQFREKSASATMEEATRESAVKQANPQKTIRAASGAKADVLTDIKGFEFNVGAYLDGVIPKVRDSWYSVIHEVVTQPEERKGKVSVEFTITRSGDIQDARVVDTSRQQELDEAALQGVQKASPLPPLPKTIPPNELTMRLHFYYQGIKPFRLWRHK